jgi:serine/threonine protein kinase
MTPSREDLELYVSGNYDGDVGALERAIVDDPAVAAIVADEARFDMLLRDAATAATFCVACNELVRGERCDNCGAAVRPGGYQVERVLVSNAHGRMYLARDADGKRVALKELAFLHAPSTAALAAFEREAKFLRALEHPAIPRFCASFEEGRGVHTRYYLAQELVEGKALDQLDDHWYSEPEIIDIAKQVLAILVYLQSLSPMVIHRDIKPANLLRRSDGSIALVDFGAAHVYGTTAGSTTIGTFGFMPIEQLAGIVDATTDVYALGASLLNLLTRQEPWRLAQTRMTINVSAPLRAYLDKLTAGDPRARFASAKDALAALDTREQLVVAKRAKTRRRRRWPLLALGAVGLAAGGGIAAYTDEPSKDAQGGYIHLVIGAHEEFDFFVDGQPWGTASYDTNLHVTPGRHEIKVQSRSGTCAKEVFVDPGFTTRLDCIVDGARDPSSPYDDRPPPSIPAPTTNLASLRVVLPPDVTAVLMVDGTRLATVDANSPPIAISPGTRHVRLVGSNGLACDDPHVIVKSRETTTLECNFGQATAPR